MESAPAVAKSTRQGGVLRELITDLKVNERPGVTAWATGAVTLLWVPALREVGPWCESVLLYSGETEYCLRAADSGWRTLCEPTAVIEHIGDDSETKPMLAYRLVLFRHRHNRVHSAAYFAAVVVGKGI